MIRDKYSYLKKYINFENFDGNKSYNWFRPVSNEDIISNETKLGKTFPKELKEFWLNIGCGSLPRSYNENGKFCEYNNHVLSPEHITNIKILKEKSRLIIPEYSDWIEYNDIPFFEISSMSDFLIMKFNNSEASLIYNMYGDKIEDNLEKFIFNLYYKSLDYYL